jgi:methyl-accepting chemotaxis protein
VAAKEAGAEVAKLAWVIAAVTVFCLLASITVANLLNRSISAPIVRLRDEAMLIAGGNIAERELSADRADEIGDLARSIAGMAGQLRQLLTHIQKKAEDLAASSEELTAARSSRPMRRPLRRQQSRRWRTGLRSRRRKPGKRWR